jgi:hypothetical protein
MHEQLTQIAVAAFADPEEPWLATRRVLTGDQAQPGRKLAAVLELAGVADGRQDGSGTNGPNPGNGLQPLTFGMSTTNGRKLFIIICEAFLEVEKLVVQLPEDLCAERRKFRLFVL